MRGELTRLGVPCPRYAAVSDAAGVAAFAAQSGWPVVLKAVRGGYDGRGVWVCDGRRQAAGGAGARGRPARRGVRPVRPRAGRAGRPVPAPAGGGLPGGADRAAGRGLPGGARAGARAGSPVLGRGRAAAGPGTRGRAGGDRAAGRGAVRDPARPAGERAGHAAAQQRALDHRGRRGPRSSSSICGPCWTCRWARRSPPRRRWSWPTCSGPRTGPGRVRPVHPRDGGRPGGEGAPVRQGGPARPQDRPRHRARRGADVAALRDRAARAASYLGTGKELPE